VASGLVVFIGLFFYQAGKGFLDQEPLTADFDGVGGLRVGSQVRLAGVDVGAVSSIDFLHVEYACDPLTEDRGRHDDGRTNDCDDRLFCTPQSLCGAFEPWAGRSQHTACGSSDDCGLDEVCITAEFRSHALHTDWLGPRGVCARYRTTHWRAHVTMNVGAEAFHVLRTDSEATVTSASVLGDQLVDISLGAGDPLGDERRIRARPSVFDDIDRFRHRIDSFLNKADDGLLEALGIVEQFQDETTLAALNGTLRNVEVIAEQIASAEGLAGALVSSAAPRDDLERTLVALRRTTQGLDSGVDKVNRIVRTVDAQIEPTLDDLLHTFAAVDDVVHTVTDYLTQPGNGASDHMAELIHSVAGLMHSVVGVLNALADERGSLGKILGDPVVGYGLGRLFNNLARHDLWASLVLLALHEYYGVDVAPARDNASPKRRR